MSDISRRLRVSRYNAGDISKFGSLVLGTIMRRAVSGPPWFYDDWPIGTADVSPGPETATGYIKLCTHYVALEEHLGHDLWRVGGICAGMRLTPELVHLVHLDHDIEGGLKVNPDTDAYHLIIAINQELRSHRIDGESIARLMVEELADSFRISGVRTFWGKTHPNQRKMFSIYEAMGLTVVGNQIAYHGSISAPRSIFYAPIDQLRLRDHLGSQLLTRDGMVFDV